MTALLFHPPQYQCVICQHNASLYRALSNPNIFTPRPHSSHSRADNNANSAANLCQPANPGGQPTPTTQPQNASSSTASTAQAAVKKSMHINDKNELSSENSEISDDENHLDFDEITPPVIVPTPPGILPAPPVGNAPNLELKRHIANSIKDSMSANSQGC